MLILKEIDIDFMAMMNGATNTKTHLKRQLIIIGCILLLAATGLTYWALQRGHASSSSSTSKTATAKGDELSVIITKEQAFAANHQVDEGLAYYDEQIPLHGGQPVQAEIMLGKAKLAYSVGKLDIARAAAESSNKVTKSYRTLQLLGDITKAQGDKRAALDYYKQALAAVPSNMPMIGPNNIKAQLTASIQELGS